MFARLILHLRHRISRLPFFSRAQRKRVCADASAIYAKGRTGWGLAFVALQVCAVLLASATFGAIGVRAQLIHTVVGGNPNNVPATSVGFNPTGLAVDSSGNLYIAGTSAGASECSVFKVDPSGVLTTVAGNGTSPYSGGPGPASGYSGDGGPATSASLNNPRGVALDAAGNIYIADSANNRIRVVNTGASAITVAGVTIQPGNIATVVGTGTSAYSGDGGPATSASLNNPNGVALDAAGNIYIVDAGNNRIRVVNTGASAITVAGVTIQPGNISTVVGIGTRGYTGDGGPSISASINSPNGVALDSAGNIYLSDGGNNVIRVVDTGTSAITLGGVTIQPGNIATVAGIAGRRGGFSGDGGPATSANLTPNSLSLDSAGNIYIGTKVSNGGGIRVVNTGISAITVAGITIQPGNIATVAGGGTGPNNGPAISALLGGVSGVALDGAGNLYIGDGNSKVVWAVVAGTNTVTIAGATIQPGNIATVAGNGTDAYSGDGGPATNAQLFYPSGIKLDSAGNIYFVDSGNSVVRAVNEGANTITITGVTIQSGDIATVAGNFAPSNGLGDGGPALDAGFSGPSGLALDGAGNLYISDQPPENHRIRAVNTGTNPITIAGVTIQPGNIATVAGGAPNPNGCGCYWSGGDGGPATSAGLINPAGLAVDSAGNIYIAESGNARIRVVNTGTSAVTIAGVTIQPGNIATVAGNGTFGYSGDGGPAIGAELNAPVDVGLDSAGNIYIADDWNHVVRVVNTGTSVITVAGVTVQPGNIATVAGNDTSGYSGDGGPAINAQFINIVGLAVDGIGNIYVDDSNSSVVRVVNTSGIINTVAGNGTFGYGGDGGPATSGEFNVPSEVALDGAGNIYVTDSFNERIRKVDALPNAILSTQTLNFGNQYLGVASSPMTTTLSNMGASPLTFSIGFNGPNSNDFSEGADTCSTLSGQLAPNSSCTINVIFMPSQEGIETANLLITDNSTDIPNSMQLVSLTGIGLNMNGTVQVTVGTNPAGLSFSVDGTPYTSTQTLTWMIGSNHTLTTTAPQTPAPGTEYTLIRWSDGTTTASDTVTASPVTISYTASFLTSYELMTAASPSNEGTVLPATGTYYALGTVVNLQATANSGYGFMSWTGPVANANIASTTVTMIGPENVTANFQSTALIVTTTAYQTDNNPDCTSGTGNTCSLLDALTLANSSVPGANITFAVSGTIGATSTTTISNNTTIDGTGQNVTISGGNATQIFVVPTGVTFDVNNLTLSNAASPSGNYTDGGAIENFGTLNISNCTFSQNIVNGQGGALANEGGTMAISDSAFNNNGNIISGNAGGAILLQDGTMTVTNTTFTGNTSDSDGAAIALYGGTLSVANSTFSGNVATGDGGAIRSNSPGGVLTVTDSTFNGNIAAGRSGILGDGGAIYATSGSVTNSTIVGNNAAGDGGGIFNAKALIVTNSTLYNNSALGAGSELFATGSLTLQNSLVAGSSSVGNCAVGNGRRSNGQIVDGGGNLSWPDTSCPGINQNPQLSPSGLQNNGGPTQTILPLPGSAVICAGLETSIATGVTTDQRGFPNENTTYTGYSSGNPCVDAGAVQTNYQSAQFTSSGYSGNADQAISPAPIVSITESGQNIGGVPVTLGFTGTGTASGLGPVTTVAGTGATFGSLSVNAAGSDSLSVDLPVLGSYALTASAGLVVNPSAPTITSANTTMFTVGDAGSFTVTTTAYPTPVLSEAGSLPSGVTFSDNHNGTGTLIGTPAVNGTFSIQFTASNGVGSNAVQSFTLTVSLPIVASVTLNPTSVPGGITNSTGIVTLNAPAFGTAAQRKVILSSDNAAVATVPASVTIAAGLTSANFTITSLTVASTSTANISASLNGGTQSAALTVTPPPGVVSLVLNPTSVVGGSANSTATVTLNAPAAGTVAERKVTLSSDTPSAATVPASVTVAVGATTATFTVTSLVVAAQANPVITAVLNGSANATLTVNPVLVASVTLNPVSVQGGITNSTGTVTLNTAAVGTAAERTVTLSSDNTSAATVPATVVVAAGATSANFTVTSLTVTATSTANISATLNGATEGAALSVTPPPGIASLMLNPTSVIGGSANSIATVTLNAPAAGTVAQRTVTLSSDTPTAATVPASVVVAAGATTATFTVTSKVVSAVANPVITATLNGLANAVLTVNSVAVVSVALNPSSVPGGITNSTGTVTLSNPAVGTVAQRTVTLSSDTPGAATVPATVIVAAGATSANFTVTSLTVATTTTVNISATLNGGTQSSALTVNPPPGVLSLALNPTSVVGGSANSTATVTLNAPAAGTAAERKVTLSSDTPTAATVPASVTVAVGATTATFTVTSKVVSAVSSPVITATLNGSATATLNVNPVVVVSVTLNPTSVQGGIADSTGTVTLNVPAVGTAAQRTITLSSGNTAAATVPATVVVAAGATSANFTVTSHAVGSTNTANISASINGSTQSDTLTVTP
jgi:List-Bact-rpt repeat protein/centrosomal CEP192-like protein/NHL repeat-containing protein/beta-propeller repeat-containing protein